MQMSGQSLSASTALKAKAAILQAIGSTPSRKGKRVVARNPGIDMIQAFGRYCIAPIQRNTPEILCNVCRA